MKKVFKNLVNNKHVIIKITFLALVCFLLFPESALAGKLGNLASNTVGGAVALVLSIIAMIFTSVFGLITTVLIKILVSVANFNNIIGVDAVEKGWVIVRDLCNMSFILILLVIAFATILKVESYNAKKMLPKLFIMAILINFSKTIFGLIIDFSQVIMLTFTSGFANGHGWFVDMFNIDIIGEVWRTDSGYTDSALTLWAISMSIIAGVIASFVTLVVIGVILAVLVYRVVMLWIYTILSPLIFLGFAFPPLQKYTGRIWEDFIKHVMVGPLLAFFIWLALTTAGDSSDDLKANAFKQDTKGEVNGITVGASAFFEDDNLQKYVITIALLIGGLMVTQQMGGVMASIAGKGMSAIQKGRGFAWGATKFGADYLNLKQARKTGFDFNPGRQVERLKTGFNRLKAEDLNMTEISAQRNLNRGGLPGYVTGFTSSGWVDQNFKGFLGLTGLGRALKTPFGADRKIKKLNDQADEKTLEADSLISKEEHASRLNTVNNEYEEKIKEANVLGLNSNEKNEIISSARTKRNEKKEALDKMKIYGSEKDTFKRKNELNEEANKLKETAGLYKVSNIEGNTALRNGIAEKSKGLSDNEDELFSQFQIALAHNNSLAAAAIAQKMVKIGGGDTLVKKFGYQANTGMNKTEAEKYKNDHGEKAYLENRGVSDFMRDIFQGRLKMDEQAVFTLQGDLSAVAEGNSHAYWRKTTNVDSKTGKLVQNTSEEAQEAQIIEDRKAENEGRARKGSRYEYGAENNLTGKFDWSKSGLTKFMNNLDINLKEMKGNRFNKNAAAVITDSPKAMEDLTKAIDGLRKMGMEKIKVGDKDVKLDEVIGIFKNYGDMARNSISMSERMAEQTNKIKS